MQYPLKSMTLGEILDTSFKVFRDNFISLVIIGLVVQALAFGFAFGIGMLALQFGGTEESVIGFAMLLALVPVLFLGPLGTAISTRLIADRYLGLQTGIGAAFGQALRILFPLLIAVFLAGLMTSIGYLLLIIPGIILTMRFALVAPACIVEGRGGFTALRRSGELTQGSYGKMFSIFLLGFVLNLLFGVVIALAFPEESLVGNLVEFGFTAFITAYMGTIWTITYFDRRCDKEGFDIEMLATSLGEDYEGEEDAPLAMD